SRERLDRRADRADAVAASRRRNARVERIFGVLQQPRDFIRDLAHRIGPRGITMEAIDDRADINRDDVAFAQYPVARNAVDDLLVDRSADHTREPVVPEEIRGRAE